MFAIKDDDDVLNNMFTFMKNFEDEADEELTLIDFKKNLDFYSIKKFKKLASAFIDSLYELTTKNDFLNNGIDIFHYEKIILVS